MDRFDLRIEVPPVSFTDLDSDAPTGEASAVVAARVEDARKIQARRFAETPDVRVNADAGSALLDEIATPDADGKALLHKAAEKTRPVRSRVSPRASRCPNNCRP